MRAALTFIDHLLGRSGTGNVAIAAALLLLPLVLAAGFLTDRERPPGHGIPARGGLLAAAHPQAALPGG